jgi:hypothetical protein
MAGTDYGITDKGFVLKRFDDIYGEINADIRSGWGVDPSRNPQGFANTLIMSVTDRLSALWELGQECYYSMYPSSASGVSLDNAAQLAGVRRLGHIRTRALLSCECRLGTRLPSGTVVRVPSAPPVPFRAISDTTVTNEKVIGAKILMPDNGSYRITINEKVYTDLEFGNAYETDMDGDELTIKSKDRTAAFSISLSANLSFVSVTELVAFESVEFGAFNIANGEINEIISRVTGFISVTNELAPSMGRDTETDEEFRKSYLRRIARMSHGTVEAIEAGILDTVPGTTEIKVFENPTDTTDAWGRPPHSFETIVEGGAAELIAQAIFDKKPVGISPHGNVSVDITDKYGTVNTVRFSRPQPVYMNARITVTKIQGASWQNDVEGLVRRTLLSEFGTNARIGENVSPQRYYESLYTVLPNASRIIILAAFATDPNQKFTANEYSEATFISNPNQQVVIDEHRLDVILNG